MRINRQTVIWWNLTLDLHQFPELLKAFQKANPKTRKIECLAADVVAAEFAPDKVHKFVTEVCEWGGGKRLLSRLFKNNSDACLANHFKESHAAATVNENSIDSVVLALGIIVDRTTYLGISFGSKHLKFMLPHRAVVLDSKISGKLGYALNRAGYGAFLSDCSDILKELKEQNIEYTGWGDTGWRVSDVEMAIFQSLKQ